MKLRLLMFIAVLSLVPALLGAQSPKPWTPGRTPDGQPDLQGTWTNPTITPFERPRELAGKDFLTEKEVKDLEARAAGSRDGSADSQSWAEHRQPCPD